MHSATKTFSFACDDKPDIGDELRDSFVDLIGKRSTSQGGWHNTHNAAHGDWNGCWMHKSTPNDDICFSPLEWLDEEEQPFAWYAFSRRTSPHGCGSWLASALGEHGSSLCFRFSAVWPKDLYAACGMFRSLGFVLGRDGILYRPFVFTADELRREYRCSKRGCDPFEVHPFDVYPLWPLEEALKAVFAVHGMVRAFVEAAMGTIRCAGRGCHERPQGPDQQRAFPPA